VRVNFDGVFRSRNLLKLFLRFNDDDGGHRVDEFDEDDDDEVALVVFV
jgi:hypothetical protein